MACPLEVTLVINSLSFPGLFREGKIKCTFNTAVILLDAFCDYKGLHSTRREAESFLLAGEQWRGSCKLIFKCISLLL